MFTGSFYTMLDFHCYWASAAQCQMCNIEARIFLLFTKTKKLQGRIYSAWKVACWQHYYNYIYLFRRHQKHNCSRGTLLALHICLCSFAQIKISCLVCISHTVCCVFKICSAHASFLFWHFFRRIGQSAAHVDTTDFFCCCCCAKWNFFSASRAHVPSALDWGPCCDDVSRPRAARRAANKKTVGASALLSAAFDPRGERHAARQRTRTLVALP